MWNRQPVKCEQQSQGHDDEDDYGDGDDKTNKIINIEMISVWNCRPTPFRFHFIFLLLRRPSDCLNWVSACMAAGMIATMAPMCDIYTRFDY